MPSTDIVLPSIDAISMTSFYDRVGGSVCLQSFLGEHNLQFKKGNKSQYAVRSISNWTVTEFLHTRKLRICPLQIQA